MVPTTAHLKVNIAVDTDTGNDKSKPSIDNTVAEADVVSTLRNKTVVSEHSVVRPSFCGYIPGTRYLV